MVHVIVAAERKREGLGTGRIENQTQTSLNAKNIPGFFILVIVPAVLCTYLCELSSVRHGFYYDFFVLILLVFRAS